jgi:hypothetical protein
MLPLMIRSRYWPAALATAIAGHDGAAACALLAPDTASELAESQGSSFAEAIRRQVR